LFVYRSNLSVPTVDSTHYIRQTQGKAEGTPVAEHLSKDDSYKWI